MAFKYEDVIKLAQVGGLSIKIKSGETKVFGAAGIGQSVAVTNPKKDGTTGKIYLVGFEVPGLAEMKTGYKSIKGRIDLARDDAAAVLMAAFEKLGGVFPKVGEQEDEEQEQEQEQVA